MLRIKILQNNQVTFLNKQIKSMFIEALMLCPEYADKLNQLMTTKNYQTHDEIDFINDSDAFKLLKLKIFKERNSSVEKDASTNNTNPTIKDSLNCLTQKSQTIVFQSNENNKSKLEKRYSLYDILSKINSNDSKMLEKTIQIDYNMLAQNWQYQKSSNIL